MSKKGKWHTFWDGCSSPFHAEDSPEFYAQYAHELAVMFPDQAGRTLEIGCGNGALYPFLSARLGVYVGVDFSQSMLDAFSQAHPDLRLVCADGSSYRDDGSYDLIFCNGVVQHFSYAMVEHMLDNVRDMLAGGGVCVIGMIPDRRLRFGFRSGYLRLHPARIPCWRTLLKYVRCGVMRNDVMGTWFDAEAFIAVAQRHGFDCRILGSMCYRYRFHAVLQRHAAE